MTELPYRPPKFWLTTKLGKTVLLGGVASDTVRVIIAVGALCFPAAFFMKGKKELHVSMVWKSQ